jgi:hypothetical protein
MVLLMAVVQAFGGGSALVARDGSRHYTTGLREAFVLGTGAIMSWPAPARRANPGGCKEPPRQERRRAARAGRVRDASALARARHASRAALGYPPAMTRTLHPAPGTWANGWPAVDVPRFEFADYDVVIARLRAAWGAESLRIDHPWGGGAVDWQVGGRLVHLLMDDFSFSIATADQALRDEILALLDGLPA